MKCVALPAFVFNVIATVLLVPLTVLLAEAGATLTTALLWFSWMSSWPALIYFVVAPR